MKLEMVTLRDAGLRANESGICERAVEATLNDFVDISPCDVSGSVTMMSDSTICFEIYIAFSDRYQLSLPHPETYSCA